ncbi:MAG: DUF2723 domain-containing protein [Planctomycetes bacterium]|nr:DUF2723 domain-containing protein [Planctomycetota bacterium]
MEPSATRAFPSPTRLLVAGTSLVVFLGYLPTVAREIPVGDSGELIAAARCLGIPHPPGYPLWCLFAHGFARLLPGVSFTFGANLSSAAAGALTAGVAAAAARALGCGAPAAFGAGILTGFGKSLWEQSAAAEIYPLNALLFAGLLLACLAPPSRGGAAGFGLLAGLSLTMHPIMRGLVPIAAVHFLWENRRGRGRGIRLALAAGGLLAGLLVLLYLPIRAATNPPLNFENPVDLRGLGRLLGMAVYRLPEENAMVREPILLGFGDRLGALGRTLLGEFPFPALLLACAGAFVAARRRRVGALALAAHAIAATVGIAAFCATRDSRLYPPSYSTYSLPAFVVLGVLAGAGLEGIGTAWRRLALPGAGLAVSAAALSLGGWAFGAHRETNDRSEDRLPADLGRNVLETVEPGGILLAWGDQVLIPCLYQQVVLGVRPDVEIATREGRVDRALLRRHGASGEGEESETQRLARAVAHLRPVYTNYFERFPEETGLESVPVGLLFRIVRKATGEAAAARARNGEVWKAYRWRTLGSERGRPEVREIEALVRGRAAEDRIAAGDVQGAVREWRELAHLHPSDAAILSNVGTGLADLGRPGEGKPFLERALALRPGDGIARTSLGGVLLATGEPERAVRVLAPFLTRPAPEIDPYLFLAQAARQAKDRDTARRALASARELFPGDPRSFVESALFEIEEGRDFSAALLYAERASGMAPADPEIRRLVQRARTLPR